MAVVIEINQVAIFRSKRFLKSWLKRIIKEVLKEIRVQEADISLALVTPPMMKKINFAYRGKNKVTDVLSFSLPSIVDKKKFVGEIIICPEQAKKQAHLFQQTYRTEIARLLIHGVLHLFGYSHDHPIAAKKMFTLTQKILQMVI